MIQKEEIENIIAETLIERNIFIVEIKVNPGNRIIIYMDSAVGITLDDCIVVNKKVESELNREIEDYELEVSSPGLTLPFKVIDQYKKNTGKSVEVKLKTGLKYKGILTEVSESGINIETGKKEKVEGKKNKQLIKEVLTFSFDEIKETKLFITF